MHDFLKPIFNNAKMWKWVFEINIIGNQISRNEGKIYVRITRIKYMAGNFM